MEQDSKGNQAKYVELNLFPEEIEDHQKDSVSSDSKENHTSSDKEYDLTDLFERLSGSAFRSRFHLSKKDKEYIAEKGLATIRKHAEDFVAKRLAPAEIPNDGKQTPMRGHPVFIAQHATGCCCRGCFFKWHHIPAGRQLTEEEQQYAVAVLMTWIEKQVCLKSATIIQYTKDDDIPGSLCDRSDLVQRLARCEPEVTDQGRRAVRP